jgi:PAS domain S-box-containing protein
MTSSPTAPPSPREEDFRALFEAAGDAIFLVEDMRFVACNHGTLALFGCAREDILGRRPWEFSPPRQADGTDSETGVRARVARALAGEPQFFEWRHRRLDGSPFDTEVQLNRIDLPEGPVLQAMVRDVSERKRAEAGLRLYQRIVADSTDHIAVLDLDYIYRLVNGTYLDAHGRDESEIVGHGVAELFGQAVFENLIREKLDRCFAGEVVRYQTWFEFKARGRRYMNVTYTPHRDQDGNHPRGHRQLARHHRPASGPGSPDGKRGAQSRHPGHRGGWHPGGGRGQPRGLRQSGHLPLHRP